MKQVSVHKTMLDTVMLGVVCVMSCNMINFILIMESCLTKTNIATKSFVMFTVEPWTSESDQRLVRCQGAVVVIKAP